MNDSFGNDVRHKAVAVLPPEEQALYDSLYSYILTDAKAGLNKPTAKSQKNARAKEVFKSDEYSFELKKTLAMKLFRIDPINTWSFRNIDGNPLHLLSMVGSYTVAARKQAVLNENFTWETVKHMMLVNTQLSIEQKNEFIRDLNDTVVTRDFITELMKIRATAGLDLGIVAARARKLFNLDESIPDEWVEKMLS